MKARETSSSSKKLYGLKRVCRAWRVPRSTVYEHKKRQTNQISKQTRGPVPKHSEGALLDLIKEDLKKSHFKEEGHRKVHARLRRNGVIVGRDRIRKVMGAHHLLSPHRSSKRKEREHKGHIITERPNLMWGTDATKILTARDGWVWFFGIIEHWNAECLGWIVVKKGDRFSALDPIKTALKKEYGSLERKVAKGLSLRSDNGSQYRSKDFIAELKYWGIHPSFGYVREPETNGVVERFHRTFKEQIIHGHAYETIGELEVAIEKFIESYNEHWLLEKLGYQSPLGAKRTLSGEE
jgi:putative transposase